MKQWRVVVCKNSHEQTGNRRYDLLKLSKKFVYSHNRCLRELKEKIDFIILGLKSIATILIVTCTMSKQLQFMMKQMQVCTIICLVSSLCVWNLRFCSLGELCNLILCSVSQCSGLEHHYSINWTIATHCVKISHSWQG